MRDAFRGVAILGIAIRTATLGVAAIGAAACGGRVAGDAPAALPAVGAAAPFSAPFAAGTSTPFLAVTTRGALVASVTQQDPGGHTAIRVATFADGAWDAVRTVTEGGDYFVNWADIPGVRPLANGDLVAHWLAREGEGTYAYGIRLARSTDGGRTWGAPVTPHDDGLEAEHGFVASWDAGDGALGLVWLDGRKTAMPDSAAEMTVRAARYDAAMARSADALLDARSCDCCPTAAALAADGPVVAWRDRSPDEIRDIVVARHADGAWQPPVRVHADDWQIDGCPVNGPALVAAGDTVAIAWFTGARDTAKVQLAWSSDGARSFGPPVRLDDGDPVGRVAMVRDADGRAVVAWVERTGEAATLRVRRVAADGARSPTTTLMTGLPARASGVPKLARLGDTLVAAWTDVTPGVRDVSGRRVTLVRAALR